MPAQNLEPSGTACPAESASMAGTQPCALSGGHNLTSWQRSITDPACLCSVLGKELISLAKKRGTKTINVVRRDKVVNELKQLG